MPRYLVEYPAFKVRQTEDHLEDTNLGMGKTFQKVTYRYFLHSSSSDFEMYWALHSNPVE